MDLKPGLAHSQLKASPKSYIGPGPDYIAPASSFFFPGTNMNTTLMDYLPTKNVSDQLIAQYFAAVHLVSTLFPMVETLLTLLLAVCR